MPGSCLRRYLQGCGSSSIPESSLTVRDALTDQLLSISEATGTINLPAGNTRQIKVLRTFRSESGQTQTDDVTQFTNFKWESGGGFASVDQLGNISGIAEGTAVLEMKFRTTPLDPWDICRMVINVT